MESRQESSAVSCLHDSHLQTHLSRTGPVIHPLHHHKTVNDVSAATQVFKTLYWFLLPVVKERSGGAVRTGGKRWKQKQGSSHLTPSPFLLRETTPTAHGCVVSGVLEYTWRTGRRHLSSFTKPILSHRGRRGAARLLCSCKWPLTNVSRIIFWSAVGGL